MLHKHTENNSFPQAQALFIKKLSSAVPLLVLSTYYIDGC